MPVFDINGNSISPLLPSGVSAERCYDLNGNVVYPDSPQWDYDDYSVTTFFRYPKSRTQGFAVYGNTIAQVIENDSLYLIDIPTQTEIRSVSMDMGHGNSCQFSDEFHSPEDEFPLFYIRNTGIWVYRIVGTTSQVIKKISFSPSILGTYVAGFGINTQTRRLYTASYTQGDYQTKTGEMRICEWDMDDETDNGDGTVSIGLLRSNDFEWFDRFEAVQGCCCHDGFFFIASGYTNGTSQNIVMVDESTLEIQHVLSQGGTQETEGCAWVGNDYLLVGQRVNTYTYKKITFAPL